MQNLAFNVCNAVYLEHELSWQPAKGVWAGPPLRLLLTWTGKQKLIIVVVEQKKLKVILGASVKQGHSL